MRREPASLRDRQPSLRRRGYAATGCLLLLTLPLLAVGPPPRGGPGSRIPDAENASEYWDLVAQFKSGHALIARFMITHEGPGRNTAIAYGHFIEPGGKIWPWTNGRREGNWELASEGRVVDVGSSELHLTGPPYRLRVRKKKAGVKINLNIVPEGASTWEGNAGAAVEVDLLAGGATVDGSVWFRGMPEPLRLSGRAGLTHTWMRDSEPKVAQRRIDFFSLHGDTLLYMLELESPEGTRSRWLRATRAGKKLFETRDFTLDASGRSGAETDARYPLPGKLTLNAPELTGEIILSKGLFHHDPMEIIPQPFRFLLSWKMSPLRVWTESPYAFKISGTPPGADPVKIDGSGITVVTYLNPASRPVP